MTVCVTFCVSTLVLDKEAGVLLAGLVKMLKISPLASGPTVDVVAVLAYSMRPVGTRKNKIESPERLFVPYRLAGSFAGSIRAAVTMTAIPPISTATYGS